MKSLRFFPLVLVVCLGCETQEDLPGHLALLSVSTQGDDCTPRRFSGDAGIQFFAVRPDGGAVFTVSQLAQFSSVDDDGGLVESVQRQSVPFPGEGSWAVGNGDQNCVGTFAAWAINSENMLTLPQSWPGLSACPSGPEWIPQDPCVSNRFFTFTPVSECNLRCVRISALGEVTCGC
ncbi:MAG: hypothetical protein QM817_11820 [Archangium sp.]